MNKYFIFENDQKLSLLHRDVRQKVKSILKKAGYLYSILAQNITNNNEFIYLSKYTIKDYDIEVYKLNYNWVAKITFNNLGFYILFKKPFNSKTIIKLFSLNQQIKDLLIKNLYKEKNIEV